MNVVAQLGTARDKSAYSGYSLALIDRNQLYAAYRTAWLPQAIVDTPADDAVRKWRAWQADQEQIEAIEAEEKRLNVRENVRDSYRAARLFGGACIYMRTRDTDPLKPLDPSRVGRGGLLGLTILTPNQLAPDQINRDIASPFYGRPEFYTLTGDKGHVKVHASRLVVFHGVPQLDVSLATDGWGDSALLAVMDAVTQADGASANIAALLFEAKIDVFRFKGMADFLKNGGPDADTALAKRLASQALLKGINGAVVLDHEDEYEQKSASFSSLPEVWDRFMLNVSGAARIPVTRLFGRSAAGLSGQGDGDERVYFDRIQALQELEIQPAMAVLDECLIRSALGERPPEVWYTWNPLRQISETDRATIFKTTADAARALAGPQAGELLPLDALSDALVNELVEQGVMPGLEQKIAEYGSLAEQGVDETPAEQIEGQGGVAAADAAPRTLYVSRKVVNAAEIIAWAKEQGFTETLEADDLHVTVAYSRTPIDWMKAGESWTEEVEIAPGGPRMMERFGEARVLLFASSLLSWRHEEIKRAGASWDYPEYQPHITISYAEKAPDLAAVKPYAGKIVLGPEVFGEIDEGWKAKVTA